jgi:AAHS family 4-hydroxybenzoate transporter-like MFS transporter
MSKAVEIDELLDGAKLRAVHVRTLAMCAIAMMIDGYDLYVVGWILPALSDSFHVSRVALTPVLLIQQTAMLISAMFVAPLGDRIGRRNLILFCLAGTGIFSLGGALSSSITEFTIWRVLTGLCAAAVVPNLVTLSSEIAPRRLRATFSTITLSGSMGGALLGAGMQGFILPTYGWTGAMYLGAALSAFIVPVGSLMMSESPRFLVRRNSADPRLPALLAKMGLTLEAGATLTVASAQKLAAGGRDRVKALLGDGRAVTTVLLWCAFIASFTFIGQWSSWSTTVFKDTLEMDWKAIATMNSLYTSLGVVGTMTIGFAIDRFGFRAVLPTTFALGFAGAVGVALTAPSSTMFICLAVMGLFQHASQAGIAALAASLFPASHRATAVGWAYGTGRIGSIIGPATGSVLVHRHGGPVETFIGFGLPLLFASVLLLFLFKRAERQPAAAALTRA